MMLAEEERRGTRAEKRQYNKDKKEQQSVRRITHMVKQQEHNGPLEQCKLSMCSEYCI